MDKNTECSKHINNICKKLHRNVFLLGQLNNSLDINELLQVFYSSEQTEMSLTLKNFELNLRLKLNYHCNFDNVRKIIIMLVLY